MKPLLLTQVLRCEPGKTHSSFDILVAGWFLKGLPHLSALFYLSKTSALAYSSHSLLSFSYSVKPDGFVLSWYTIKQHFFFLQGGLTLAACFAPVL